MKLENPAAVGMREKLYSTILKSKLVNIESICLKDAKRTFTNKEIFSGMDKPGCQLVYNICKGIGAFFPRAGYCQGNL